MPQPLVSVIVPNYNYARYLEERIESILGQSFQDFELILLDDCSTDESRSILERYATHPKVSHYVPNEHNSGSPFAQWERGLELAQGKYVWIAESDDSCTPELLEQLVSILEAEPEAVMAHVGSVQIDEEGKPLTRDFDGWEPDGSLHRDSPEQYLYKAMRHRDTLYNASKVLFRRTAAESIDKTYARMRYCGDGIFWLELSRWGDVLELRLKLNRFRQHTQRVTMRSDRSGERLREQIDIARYIEERYPLGWMERHRRRGQLYKECSRLRRREPELGARCLGYLREQLGATRRDFLLERLTKGLGQLTGRRY
jgi:glycosyltransferase, group 1 family